jgi:hypothetical protein
MARRQRRPFARRICFIDLPRTLIVAVISKPHPRSQQAGQEFLVRNPQRTASQGTGCYHKRNRPFAHGVIPVGGLDFHLWILKRSGAGSTNLRDLQGAALDSSSSTRHDAQCSKDCADNYSVRSAIFASLLPCAGAIGETGRGDNRDTFT